MDGLDQVTFEPVRCIGCGLCLSVYPSSAVQLVRKPESEQPKIPKDTARTYINIARVQGVGKVFNLVRMMFLHLFRRITLWVKPGE